MFVSQNGGAGAALPFLAPDMILSRLAADAGLAAPDPDPVPDAAGRAQALAGRYLSNRRVFSGPWQIFGATDALTVTALPDGSILVPAPILQTVARYWPVAPDVWESALGERIVAIRGEDGRVLRLADGMGIATHERVTPATDPMVPAGAIGLAALLSVTTLLGLLWRRGLAGGNRAGTVAALTGLAGAVSVWALVAAGVAMALVAGDLGMAFLIDQPQPTLVAFLTLGDAVAVLAVLGLAALIPVWARSGWGLWRRRHQSALALALGALAVALWRWGVAFGGAL